MPNLNDIIIMRPEFFLVAAACVLLLADAFMKPAERPYLHWLSIGVLAVTIYLVLAFQPAGPVTAFHGMFILDGVSEILKVFSLLCTILVFIYGRPYLNDRKLLVGEFYTLMIFAVDRKSVV